jgi:hypothetical protein
MRTVITDTEVLEYLHDATVFEVNYDLRDKNSRSLTLLVQSHPEAGFAEWDGKRLRVRIESIAVMSFVAFGAIIGNEEVNSFNSRVSPAMEAEIARLRDHGYHSIATRFAVTFQSGSVLEGLCERIVVEEELGH